MSKKAIRFAACLILLLCLQVFAQQQESLAPFNLDQKRLPPNYHGMDAELIRERILARSRQAQKDEFETTEQFRQRIRRLEAEPFAGNLTTDSLLAFEVAQLTTAYDADNALMKVIAAPYKLRALPRAASLRTPPIIEALAYMEFANSTDFGPTGSSGDEHPSIVESIKMDIPTARKAKESLRALAVVRLRSPYITERGYPPRSLYAELLEVWFYDLTSGEIYAKTKVEELKKRWQEAARAEAESKREALNKALELYDAGKDEEAMTEARRLLLIEPMHGGAYLLIGRIYLRRGDEEAAVSTLKTALFWDSKLVDAHILLARIFLGRGNRGEATRYAENALRLDPENQEAAALLRSIKGGNR